MKQTWLEAKSKYESLARRERILLLAAGVAVVYMGFELLVLKPLDDRYKLALAQQQVAAQALNTTEAELLVIKSLASKEPFAPLKEEKRRLAQTLVELDLRVTELNQGLLTAEQLPQALQFLLGKADKLQLRRFQTMPATAVAKPEVNVLGKAILGKGVESTAGDDLFRYQVLVEVEGNYQQFIDYLRAIETSDWNFREQSLHYRVLRESTAQLQIRLYTITTGPGRLDG